MTLAVNPQSPCVFTKGLTRLDLPVRHGEGKLVPLESAILEQLMSSSLLAWPTWRPRRPTEMVSLPLPVSMLVWELPPKKLAVRTPAAMVSLPAPVAMLVWEWPPKKEALTQLDPTTSLPSPVSIFTWAEPLPMGLPTMLLRPMTTAFLPAGDRP